VVGHEMATEARSPARSTGPPEVQAPLRHQATEPSVRATAHCAPVAHETA